MCSAPTFKDLLSPLRMSVLNSLIALLNQSQLTGCTDKVSWFFSCFGKFHCKILLSYMLTHIRRMLSPYLYGRLLALWKLKACYGWLCMIIFPLQRSSQYATSLSISMAHVLFCRGECAHVWFSFAPTLLKSRLISYIFSVFLEHLVPFIYFDQLLCRRYVP